jgi:hypothetical protein
MRRDWQMRGGVVPPALLFVALGLALAFAPRSAWAAHDFWLQPSEYWMSPDALTSMTLQVGHGPFRQRSPIPARRITRFQAIAPEGAVVDLREQLRLGEASEDAEGPASFTMPDAGTWLLNVIWTKALTPSDETDFETVFSSVSFGFPSDPP